MFECNYHGTWKQSGWRQLWLLPCLVLLDQFTKLLVIKHLAMYQVLELLPGLDMVHVRNVGVSFGLLGDPVVMQRYLLTVLAVLVSMVLLYVLRRTPAKPYGTSLGLLCVVSGALGNALDRVLHGAVIDFIDVYWRTYHWPAFNVADALICFGVFILLCLEFRAKN